MDGPIAEPEFSRVELGSLVVCVGVVVAVVVAVVLGPGAPTVVGVDSIGLLPFQWD